MLLKEVGFKELKETGLSCEIDLLDSELNVFLRILELEFNVKFINLFTPLLSSKDSKRGKFAFRDV